MSTYPTTPRSAFLGWCQGHAKVFVDNAAAIGLTPAQATAFKTATDTTAAATQGQQEAKQAGKVATEKAANSYTSLHASAGEAVRLIRAFAESQADPAVVYELAQIPPPTPPSPAPAPAQPQELSATLDPTTGHLTLRWKATNPRGGTTYLVSRKLPGQADFAFLGVTGLKNFVDSTLPAGPQSVQYIVQGQRADSSGPVSAVLVVNFGKQPGEVTTSSATAAAASATSTPSVMDAIINSKPLTNGKRAPARI